MMITLNSFTNSDDFKENSKYNVTLTGRQIEILENLILRDAEDLKKHYKHDPEVLRRDLGFYKRMENSFRDAILKKGEE